MRWLAGTIESSCTEKDLSTSGMSSGRMVMSMIALLKPEEKEGRKGVGVR